MKTFNRTASLILLCAWMSAWGAGQTSPSATRPRLSCSVNSEAGENRSSEDRIKVSNLKRIPFTITLSGLDAESSDLRVRAKGDNTRATNSPTIEIMATRISDANSESVPLKFARLGVSKILDSVSVTGRLEIPVEEEKRKEDMNEYLKKIEAASRKEGKEAEFKHLTRNRQSALAIYESMYVDNRVGEFEITCQYNPVRPGHPHGIIKSSPVRVQVVFEGKFFDQPKFKLN